MPKIIEGLTLSDSLYKLIQDSQKTKCCKLLALVFERVQSSAVAKGDCPCPDCRRARKGQKWLNEKRMGDYFTFREKPGMISYMPKGKKQAITEEGRWERKGRVEIKPAKWIKSMLHPRLAKRLKDHHFAAFDTAVKAEEEAQKISFKIVSIQDAYNSSNYSDDTRPESCMWDRKVGPFYKLLGAKAVVGVNGKGIYVGRAVLWPHVKAKNGQVIQLLDRIYSRSPEVTELFKAHAQEKGWYHKYKQNRSNLLDVVDPDGVAHSWTMTVEAEDEFDEDMYFPYLDTFQGGRDNSSLTNIRHESDKSILFSYTSTDGTREELEDHTGEVMDSDGNWIPEADAVYVDGYGTVSRHNDRFRECEHTNVWYHRDRCVYIRRLSMWVHEDYEEHYLTQEEKAERKRKQEEREKQYLESMKSIQSGWSGIQFVTTYTNSGTTAI